MLSMLFHGSVVEVSRSCNGSVLKQSSLVIVSTLKDQQYTPGVHKNPKQSAAIDKQVHHTSLETLQRRDPDYNIPY